MTGTMLKVGNWSVAPGDKRVGTHELMVDGHQVIFPVFAINGRAEGPTLVVTAGIHGAEYASIAAALEFGQKLQPDGLKGRVIVAPIANMPSFRARSIYVTPLDGKNLNRVFPGKADGTASEQIANWLYQNLMLQASHFVDLHGGDLVEELVPYAGYHKSGNDAVDNVSIGMAKAFGLAYLMQGVTVGSSYSVLSRAGIPSILAEAGAQGLWPRNWVQMLLDGLDRLTHHLGMLAGPAPAPAAVKVFEQSFWLRSEHEGFWYPGIEVGATVTKGQNLGKVTDYQGNSLQVATAPASGKVMFVVSSLAINKGDPLLALGA